MNRSQFTRTFAGILFLLLGGALLLQNTNVIDIADISKQYWPLLIVLAGLMVLLNNVKSWLFALFLVLLGGLYQLRELDVVSFEPWPVIVSLFFIAVGLSFIFRQSYINKNLTKDQRDDVTAIMGGADTTNASQDFKAAKLTAIMGGAKIDLRKAVIKDEAVIEVFAFWGGVEILVPKDVVIRNRLNNIMAGTDDRTEQESKKGAPVIVITGDIIMAGVDIRNTAR